MTQHQFTNALRSLFNIDGCQLPELTDKQQREFVRDPVRYFMHTDDEQQAAIFREVEKRQPAKEQSTLAGAIDVLRRIEDMGPVTCEMTTAHEMADLARQFIAEMKAV